MNKPVLAGFDWDEGNWPKCGKHGLTRDDIESLFAGEVAVHPDPRLDEERSRAIGHTASGRMAFVVFTLRQIGRKIYIRPISARFMHEREIRRYDASR